MPRLLHAIAMVQEAYARLSGKPVLLSLATVNNRVRDDSRQFSSDKIATAFGPGFRPLAQTLSDEVMWLRRHHAQ